MEIWARAFPPEWFQPVLGLIDLLRGHTWIPAFAGMTNTGEQRGDGDSTFVNRIRNTTRAYNACSMSAIRSSTSSIPTLSRTRVSVMPRASLSSLGMLA